MRAAHAGDGADLFRRWFHEVIAEPVPAGVSDLARRFELDDMREQLDEIVARECDGG